MNWTLKGRRSLSNNTVVPVQLRQFFVGVAVALDVSVHRRHVPADLCRDFPHRDLCIQHILNHAPVRAGLAL